MAPKQCKHVNRAWGAVDLDFSRRAPDRSVYSAEISVGVCEECGHIELYPKSHQTLCDWLTKKN